MQTNGLEQDLGMLANKNLYESEIVEAGSMTKCKKKALNGLQRCAILFNSLSSGKV